MGLSIVNNSDGTITIGCTGGGGGGGGAGQGGGAGGGIPPVVIRPKENPFGGWGKAPGGDVALVRLGDSMELPANLGALGAGQVDPASIQDIARKALEAGRRRHLPVLSVELTLQPGQHVDIGALRRQMGELSDQVQLLINVPQPARDDPSLDHILRMLNDSDQNPV